MTFDLYLGQVKGQLKNFGQNIFSSDSQVPWYDWILAISSWDFTIRIFICPFFSTFSVIFPWQHDIWVHTSGYELFGPWPMCLASFIEISCELGQNWALVNYDKKKKKKNKRFQVTALWNMLDLDFDLSRSLYVKANCVIWESIHDFLFNFNSNHDPNCKRFEVTALGNMLDLPLTSPGHSTSKPTAPFERTSMTSYSTLIVTVTLTASVSKLQPLELRLTSLWPLPVTLRQRQLRHLREHLWLPIQL